ncbi:hypothetical protein PSPO01_10808 [Paraphaeosphaeria sporulosa]
MPSPGLNSVQAAELMGGEGALHNVFLHHSAPGARTGARAFRSDLDASWGSSAVEAVKCAPRDPHSLHFASSSVHARGHHSKPRLQQLRHINKSSGPDSRSTRAYAISTDLTVDTRHGMLSSRLQQSTAARYRVFVSAQFPRTVGSFDMALMPCLSPYTLQPSNSGILAPR